MCLYVSSTHCSQTINTCPIDRAKFHTVNIYCGTKLRDKVGTMNVDVYRYTCRGTKIVYIRRLDLA